MVSRASTRSFAKLTLLDKLMLTRVFGFWGVYALALGTRTQLKTISKLTIPRFYLARRTCLPWREEKPQLFEHQAEEPSIWPCSIDKGNKGLGKSCSTRFFGRKLSPRAGLCKRGWAFLKKLVPVGTQPTLKLVKDCRVKPKIFFQLRRDGEPAACARSAGVRRGFSIPFLLRGVVPIDKVFVAGRRRH